MSVYHRIQSLINCIEIMLQIGVIHKTISDKTFFSLWFNETHYLEYHTKNAIVQMVSFRICFYI